MGKMAVTGMLVAMMVSWGLCTVIKVAMGKMAMSRMVVTGKLEVIWSPGGCVPCGAAGQPATPQSGSDPQATNTFLANLADCPTWYLPASTLQFDSMNT